MPNENSNSSSILKLLALAAVVSLATADKKVPVIKGLGNFTMIRKRDEATPMASDDCFIEGEFDQLKISAHNRGYQLDILGNWDDTPALYNIRNLPANLIAPVCNAKVRQIPAYDYPYIANPSPLEMTVQVCNQGTCSPEAKFFGTSGAFRSWAKMPESSEMSTAIDHN
jgi:hypothetical protein